MKLTPPGFHPKKWNILGILSLLIITILSSCKNDPKEIISGDGNIKISLAGIEDYTTIDKVAATRKSNNNTPVEIQSYEGFDAITSIEVEEPTAAVSTKKASSEVTKLARNTTKLQDTVRYRLLFFKASDNSVVVNELIKAGDAPRIRLDIGVTYKWVAYSINTANVPDITENIINKNDLANKDLLYASNTITIQPGDNFLNLTLKRYTTQYEVNVDTRGMFAAIDEDTRISLSNTNGDLFKTADFNILTGQFEGSATLVTLKGSDLIVDNILNDNNQKKAIFHTVIESEITLENELKLNFLPLNLALEDNGTIRNFPSAIINLTHNAITGTSTRGRKYKINAMLIESAVQVGTSNTKWARSNLWYDENNTISKYRLRPSPHFRDMQSKNSSGFLKDEKDLWRFSTTTPNGTEQEVGFDPCNKVFPEGLWKMASDEDFTSLTVNNPDSLYIIDRDEPWWTVVLGLIGNSKYYEMSAVYKSNTQNRTPGKGYSQPYRPNDPRSTMDNLVFSGVGRTDIHGTIYERPIASSVLSIGELVKVLPVISGGGFYWTSKGLYSTSNVTKPTYFEYGVNGATVLGVNLLEILQLNVLSFNGYFKNIQNNNFVNSTDFNSTANWRARLNIRCVRDPNYTN